MKIQPKDMYHGAVLTQIVEHESFTALNKADEKYGHYIVNVDIRLLVKYASNGNPPWQFTFNPADLETIQEDREMNVEFYTCLVCGDNTVCLLTSENLDSIMDINRHENPWVRVESPPNSSMRVSGPLGRLARRVPHNAFPDRIFE